MTQIDNNITGIENDTEIDLKQLFLSIWRGKWWILPTLIFSIFIGVQYLIEEPRTYTARAVFGFQDNKRPLLPQGASMILGISGFDKDNDAILTQITGGNFLREIVLKLNLLEKPEFKNLMTAPETISYFSVQNLKMTVKKLLGIGSLQKPLSKSDKVELIVKMLRRELLKISSLKTGGFEVIAHSTNPKEAALMANTVVRDFLDLRLKMKISKSEKSLDYLSGKLNEAKLKMEKATGAAETFALEQNVLSSQEFAIQSSRLKEFRISIEKQNEILKKMNYFHDRIQSKRIMEDEYESTIEAIIDLSPRTKPSKRFLDEKGKRAVKKEFEYIRRNLSSEITRLEESKQITLEGFAKLEEKAKKTSAEARQLQNLNMDVTFATTRYQVLLKEFETQSLIEGYEEALGEIYETALPPIYPSRSSPILVLAISLVLGFFLGSIIALLHASMSNRIFDQKTFKINSGINNILILSKSLKDVKKLLLFFFKNKKSSKIKKDLVMINSIGSIISEDKEASKKLTITCGSVGSHQAVFSVAISLAYYFSRENRPVLLLDYTSSAKQWAAHLTQMAPKVAGNSNEIINLGPNLSYLNKHQKIVNEGSNTHKPAPEETSDIVIQITEQIESEPNSLRQTLSSDFFILVALAKKTKIKDLQRFRKAAGSKLERCVSGIFVAN